MQLKFTEILNEASAKIDIFGQHVGINFKGRSSVTSKLGALVTLLTVGLGVSYLYFLASKLIYKDDPKIIQYSKGMNLLENPTTYNLSESKFSIGFTIFDLESGEFVDLQDFGLLLQTSTQTDDAYRLFKELELHQNVQKPCDTENGDFDEINLNANVNKWQQGHLIHSSMCFDLQNITLQSDFELLGKGLILQFETFCHDPELLYDPKCQQLRKKYHNESSLLVVIFHQDLFVDLDDYSDPIKGQITVINTFTLAQLQTIKKFPLQYVTKATLSLNQVELTDDIFQSPFQQQKISETNFFTIDSLFTSIYPKDESISTYAYRLQLSLSKKKTKTTRQVYDFFTLLCDIGGFNGTILTISSFLLAHLYSSHLFYYTIVRELFYFDLNKYLSTAKVKKITKNCKASGPDDLHNADLVKLINRVLNYLRFKIPLQILLAVSFCKKPPYLSKFAQFQLYQIDEGQKYIEDSLNIQTLVKTRAKVDLLMKLLFSRQEQWLVEHQRLGNLVFNDGSIIEQKPINNRNNNGTVRISQRNQVNNVNYNHLRGMYNLDVSKRKTKLLLSGFLKNKRTITINEPIYPGTEQLNATFLRDISQELSEIPEVFEEYQN